MEIQFLNTHIYLLLVSIKGLCFNPYIATHQPQFCRSINLLNSYNIFLLTALPSNQAVFLSLADLDLLPSIVFFTTLIETVNSWCLSI